MFTRKLLNLKWIHEFIPTLASFKPLSSIFYCENIEISNFRNAKLIWAIRTVWPVSASTTLWEFLVKNVNRCLTSENGCTPRETMITSVKCVTVTITPIDVITMRFEKSIYISTRVLKYENYRKFGNSLKTSGYYLLSSEPFQYLF